MTQLTLMFILSVNNDFFGNNGSGLDDLIWPDGNDHKSE